MPIGALNVLIGANGSGKSNFIAFFRMMNALLENKVANGFIIAENIGLAAIRRECRHFDDWLTKL